MRVCPPSEGTGLPRVILTTGFFQGISDNAIFPGLYQVWILFSKFQELFQNFLGCANLAMSSVSTDSNITLLASMSKQ